MVAWIEDLDLGKQSSEKAKERTDGTLDGTGEEKGRCQVGSASGRAW